MFFIEDTRISKFPYPSKNSVGTPGLGSEKSILWKGYDRPFYLPINAKGISLAFLCFLTPRREQAGLHTVQRERNLT